jgi:hypothetical protein
MIPHNKDCGICVYNGPCIGRKDRLDIKDCCIPELPLRQLQRQAKTAEEYIRYTQTYIQNAKKASHYWRKTLGVE